MSQDATDTGKRRDRRGVWLAAAGVVVLLGGLYVAGHFLLGDRLPVGTRVAGVSVGAMKTEDAHAKIERSLDAQGETPIKLRHEKQEFEVDPQDAGLALDIDETLRDAGAGRTWNPVRMVRVLVGTGHVDPVLDVDDDKLAKSTERIADAVDKPAVEPQITFPKGKPKPRKPANGVQVDQEATADLIRDSYLVDEDAGTVPTRTTEPTVGADELERALSEYAEPAVAGPVTLKVTFS